MENQIDVLRRDPAALMDSLGHLVSTPIATEAERAQVVATCETLRRPANIAWLKGRIGALLSHFYVSPLSEAVMQAIADDWIAVICENSPPPEWAMTKACRWWLSAENPNRNRKPQAGDIAERVRHELGLVTWAETRAKLFRPNGEKRAATDRDAKPALDPARIDAILKGSVKA